MTHYSNMNHTVKFQESIQSKGLTHFGTPMISRISKTDLDKEVTEPIFTGKPSGELAISQGMRPAGLIHEWIAEKMVMRA
uniref:Uncharacterized protein n=1 Tax=Candidatus Kentrum sp. SD TaxID=2126332 RepID=A0A451BNQ3_9GAMM|nr:MAG: hypothetical protein BECKSD772D_GA0070982_107311 [Candidatus Kentron sp. SD]